MNGMHRISQNLLTNLAVRTGQSFAINKPVYIFLEVTNRCNLACIMCGRTHDPRYEMPGHCGDLTLERVKKLDSFFPYATFTIPTGVGEPFINLELVPILKYLKGKGTQVSLTSNGTLLTKTHAAEIIRCGLDKIVFSIDGATKQTFEKIRVHANFELIMRNIRRLQELKQEMNSPFPVVEFEMVAMADNFPELPQWAEMAAELGIQGLIVQNLFDHSGEDYERVYRVQNLKNIPYTRGKGIWDSFLKTATARNLYVNSAFFAMDLREVFGEDLPENFQRPLGVAGAAGPNNRGGHLQLVNSHPDQAGQPAACGQADTPAESLVQIQAPSPSESATALNPGPMYCTQPWSVLYMAWNGDIRTCCFNDYALGNIDRQGIDDIWNGHKYRAMRKSVARGQVLDVCRDCLNGKSNYSVVPRLDPTLLYQEIRTILHQALM